MQKRVAAIHDISGFGRCSITTALPILSSCGIETCVLPTAVLSSHTGIEGFFCRDLTQDMKKTAKHWQSLNLTFNAVYSGYLASKQQIKIVCDFIDTFKQNGTLILVDPAMADDGFMYKMLDLDFAKEMITLVKKADIITPNITEAAFLTGEAYLPPPHSTEYITKLIDKLTKINDCHVVLTGVSIDENQIGAAVYDKSTKKITTVFNSRISGNFSGTGDMFASAFLASFLNKKSLIESAEIAGAFTSDAIKRTKTKNTDHRFGVDFERGIPKLIKDLELDS